MKFSKEHALEILKAKGIDVRKLAASPALFERSCSLVYKAVPIPWRWFIGKNRVRALMTSLLKNLTSNTSEKKAVENRATAKVAGDVKQIIVKARVGSAAHEISNQKGYGVNMSNRGTRNIDFQALYSRIPADLQDAIYSRDTSDAIESIAGKYNLNLFRMGDLSEEVGFVMLGVTHPRDLIANLSRKLQPDVETATKVAEDVDRMIFQKVAGSLRKIHGIMDQEWLIKDSPLDAKTGVTKVGSFIKCGNCGAQVETPANFCDMCGSRLELPSEREIGSSDSNYETPADEHFTKAIARALLEDHAEAIREARQALQLGLLGKDEVFARSILGYALLSNLDQETMEAGSEELLERVAELEKTLSLDAEGKYGFFEGQVQKAAWIAKLEAAYSLRARWIRKNQGIDQAIKYLKDRLRLFEYWSGTYLVLLNFELGNLCREKGDYTAAKTYWLRSMDAEPLSEENGHERQTKEMAKNNLEVLESDLGSRKQVRLNEVIPGDMVKEGWRLLGDGKISDALYVAAKAIKSSPDDPEAWALSAQAKFQWGEIQDEASYYFDLGSVYESKEQWDDALQQYERASQIEPNATMYRAAMGAIYVKKGIYKKGIDLLERCVREDPDNTTYQYFLALAYHDTVITGWWKNPHDNQYYCISKAQADEAQKLIAKAKSLRIDDPEQVAKIAETEKLVQSMYTREFKGSWIPVIVFGVFYIIPGVLWWFVNRRYRYKINKDIHDIVELGKADSLEGGEAGVYFSLLPPGFKWVAYSLPRFVVWGIVIVLAPITFFYSLYDNYIAE